MYIPVESNITMVPIPKEAVLKGKSFPVSPTGLMHSIPRPMSPRDGDKKGPGGPGLLAAEYFHTTDKGNTNTKTAEKKESRAKRTRSRDRMGQFPSGCMDSGTPTILVAPSERVHTCTTTSIEKSKALASQVAPVAKDGLRGCVVGSFIVGRRMTECLAIAADVYKQECAAAPNQQFRGDDAMFFVKTQGKNFARIDSSDDETDDNSVTMSESAFGTHSSMMATRQPDSSVRRKGSNSRNKNAAPPSESTFNLSISGVAFDPSRKNASPTRKTIRRSPKASKSPSRQRHAHFKDPGPDVDEDAPFRSHKGLRYPQAANMVNESSFILEPPTPKREYLRRPRGAYEQNESELEFQQPSQLMMQPPGTEYTDLRDLRLQMFHQDKKTDKIIPQARFARTLQELERQDQSIQELRTELNETKELLVQTTRELDRSHKSAAQHQQAIAAKDEQFFTARIDVEEKLREEMRENEKLLDKISGLHDERLRLRTTLEQEQSGAGTEIVMRMSSSSSQLDETNPQLDETNPQCGATLGLLTENSENSQYLSSTIIALRAEIVDLKSQLAEARAAQLTAEQCNKEIEVDHLCIRAESERLNDQVRQLKKDIGVLNRLSSRKEKEEDLEMQQLQAEIRGMQQQLGLAQQDAANRTIESDKIGSALSQTQDEAASLRKQVSDFKSELDRIQQQSHGNNIVNDDEGRKLQEEISELRHRLAKSNEEIIDQASGHLEDRGRIQEALSQSRQEAKVLQRKIITLDGQVAAAELEASELRSRLEDDEDKMSRTTDASRASQIVRYMNRKMNGADTSVMELLRRQRNLDDDAM